MFTQNLSGTNIVKFPQCGKTRNSLSKNNSSNQLFSKYVAFAKFCQKNVTVNLPISVIAQLTILFISESQNKAFSRNIFFQNCVVNSNPSNQNQLHNSFHSLEKFFVRLDSNFNYRNVIIQLSKTFKINFTGFTYVTLFSDKCQMISTIPVSWFTIKHVQTWFIVWVITVHTQGKRSTS